MLFITIILIGLYIVSTIEAYKRSQHNSLSFEDSNNYNLLGRSLLSNDNRDNLFADYTLFDICSTIKKLASTQSSIKKLDGLSHLMNSAVSEKR